jgi:phosphatidylglycerol:prolipoprotein diacylglycerol transferase
MKPELFHIGPLVIYSYGFMLGVAFLVANLLLTRELKRRKLDPGHATVITFFALIGGIAGAKLFHILENFNEFLASPIKMTLSSGGLTWYGGFIVATTMILIYMRRKKLSFLMFADMVAPGLAIAYGIARIGCQLAGDGDYGIPTTFPLAMTYPHGTVSTLSAANPELAQRFTEIYPGVPVPADIPVHPAPLYELVLAIPVFLFLQLRRKKELQLGNQFGWFLILHSLCRLCIEFIRINPILLFGLSQAQVISIALIALGAYYVLRKPGPPAAQTNIKK